jgi:LPS export ABC transporter permease LptG/LPS export ABC transporter permease LptF
MNSEFPTSLRPGAILYRYLAKELLVPTCFALGAFTLVVLTKDFTGYSELVINRGAGLARVGQIVLLQAVPLMSQMLPFAVLVGVLMGLGRLGADREILIISALGIEPRRLIAPVALFGTGAALFGLMLALFIAPWANRGVDQSLREIAQVNPAAEIQPAIVSRFGDWKLEAREVSSSGQMLGQVLLWIPSVGETVFAETAEVGASGEDGLEIVLHNGTLLLNTRKSLTAMRFEEMRSELPNTSEFLHASPEDRLAGMPLSELSELSQRSAPSETPGDPQTGDLGLVARSELHRRFVLPTAALLFGVIAVPLAFTRKNASRSSGAMLGLVVTIAYYGLVQLAEGVTQRDPELVALAAWLPNAALFILTALLYRRLSRPWASEQLSGRSSPGKLSQSVDRIRSSRGVYARHWALPRYVAKRFVQLSLACFAALVAAYLLVDILERLQWFARHAASADDIILFYSARIPLLVSRVVPMGLLVSMALTVSLLTSEGELVGMRSCGISAPHALRPALLVCLIVTPLSFLLNDQVVPRTNQLADLIKQRDIKGEGTQRTAVWGTNGRALYELESLDTSLGTADEIVVYQLAENGLPESRIDARSARYAGNGSWRLSDTTGVEIDVDGSLVRTSPSGHAELGEQPSDELDLMHLSVREIWGLIRELASTGDSTTAFEVDLHLKLATPLACLLLPALVMIYAVSGPPFPSSALTLVLAGVLAVAYTLTAGTFASFGRGGVLPPWAGGWGPSLVAMSALIWLAWRTRHTRREN